MQREQQSIGAMYPHKQHQHAHQRHLQQAVRNRLTTVTNDRPAHAVLQSNHV